VRLIEGPGTEGICLAQRVLTAGELVNSVAAWLTHSFKGRPAALLVWLRAAPSNRKSALFALYLAAGRLLSEPRIMTSPVVVHTRHFHVRPRFFKSTA